MAERSLIGAKAPSPEEARSEVYVAAFASFYFWSVRTVQPPGLFRQPFVRANLPQSNALCNREQRPRDQFYKRMGTNCGGRPAIIRGRNALPASRDRARRPPAQPRRPAVLMSGIAGKLGTAAKIANHFGDLVFAISAAARGEPPHLWRNLPLCDGNVTGQDAKEAENSPVY